MQDSYDRSVVHENISEFQGSQYNVDFGSNVEIFDDNKAYQSYQSSTIRDTINHTEPYRGEQRRYSEQAHQVTVEEENSQGQIIERTFSNTQE